MMITSLIYILLAILALSFLIFIHELGHFWMARRVGMRVETFAIGFGRPLWVWEHEGVKWQIGWLPFGGYVKIAGTENDGNIDPYDVPDGFYGRGAWNRIKVAFMGPFVNLLFAFAVFALLWSLGGREQNFSEVTSKVGWVDPNSELYIHGVRPGDEITSYDGRPYRGIKDHLYAAITAGYEVSVQGYHYDDNGRVPFKLQVKPYSLSSKLDKNFKTLGILSPAAFLIYENNVNGTLDNSPMKDSGILPGDRIVWVDGVAIFSPLQLEKVLNDGRTLLTIERNGKVLLARVPRIRSDELKFDTEFREELVDWQFEAQLNKIKTTELYTIPYNISNECIVENRLKFIDHEKDEEVFAQHPFAVIEAPLQAGDKIIAIDGSPIDKAFQLLADLQNRRVNIIVERPQVSWSTVSWNDADLNFDSHFNSKAIEQIAARIGTSEELNSKGDFYLLGSVQPVTVANYLSMQAAKSSMFEEVAAVQREIEEISDIEKRNYLLHQLQEKQSQLMLGLPYRDRKVNFNPNPVDLFDHVFEEIGRTLEGLFTGALSPKWLSGPVGIIQVVHDNWMVSAKNAIFWIGAISLNLGILNLLPIPILDGGTIAFAMVELFTRRKIHPKTLEKLVLPFALLLIFFFIYITYQDIARIFSRWIT